MNRSAACCESINGERRNFPSQASLDACTSLEQGTTILLQADARADDDETATSEQAAAREEFARASKKRQQQRMTAWGDD